MTDLKKQCDAQEYFMINDEAYDRIYNALKSGVATMKSYIGVCPHKEKSKCVCPYYLNYLDENGDMVRNVNGVVKPVYKESNVVNRNTFITPICNRCNQELPRMSMQQLLDTGIDNHHC